ncbi:hypothetical protein [Chromobacterium subtsugae]|uniref:hypothetical protein n=1 Tax=Chromobacterium subtsugae TaxID=251747 RepID=UPI0012FF6DDF|nr:hypothetical protein [Chromobacterium subtsugae]
MSEWLALPIIFIFMLYVVFEWPLYRYPLLMLIAGIAICIFAYQVGAVLEFVQLKGRLPKGVDIKEAIAVTSLSLGALGGGVVSAAITQKAKQSYVDKIESLESGISLLAYEIKEGRKAETTEGLIYALDKEKELGRLERKIKAFKKYL